MNLSWIKLLIKAEYSYELAIEHTTRTSQTSDDKKLEKDVTAALIRLVSKNTKLAHLDLTGTGLNSDILTKLAKPIRNSPSLVGVHFSNNPGVCNEVEELF